MEEPFHGSTTQSALRFEAADLATNSVVVYCDRAEVRRVVTVALAKGTNEIVIENVSAVIERESVRVDGKGVLIQEVQYQEMPVDSEQGTERIRIIEREKIIAENERFAIEDEMSSLRKQIEVLDGVAGQIATGPSVSPSSTSHSVPNMSRRHTITESTTCHELLQGPLSIGFLATEDPLSNLMKFLAFYGETVSSMKTTLRLKQREWEQHSEKIEALERQIDHLRCGNEYDSIKRNITILVEMESPASVELFVSYQVYCASWRPAYDIRAVTTNEGGHGNTVKLCYYGIVEQNTGDNWSDTDMVLTTSSPSVGGCAPQLATLSAVIQRANKHQRQRYASAIRRKPMYAASEEDMGFGSFDCNEMTDAVALHRYNTAQHSKTSEESGFATHNVENCISTCFSISRMISIPSNGVRYKVLIATFDLACTFVHECVPSRCDSAYLSAIVSNTTTFPLSPGDVAVYLNNGFITKFHLGVVLPGEEFRCSLGVDSSIKVECKTPTICKTQVGFMSKSTLVTHEQVVSLRNAKVTQAVQLTVWEQIPKSTDEKIKVCVVSPDVRGKSEAILNKDHNLEWKFVLESGQHRDLYIKYTVEHPASELISYKLLSLH